MKQPCASCQWKSLCVVFFVVFSRHAEDATEKDSDPSVYHFGSSLGDMFYTMYFLKSLTLNYNNFESYEPKYSRKKITVIDSFNFSLFIMLLQSTKYRGGGMDPHAPHLKWLKGLVVTFSSFIV